MLGTINSGYVILYQVMSSYVNLTQVM